jgi:hypothetical protein
MGGLRWRGAAITAATVAVIAIGSLVGMLVWGAPAFRLAPGAGSAVAESPDEHATASCTVNGAVFVRALVTSCSAPARSTDRTRGIAASSGRHGRADELRGRRPRRRVATDAPLPASGRVAPVPDATSPAAPAPIDPVPDAPTPVIAVVPPVAPALNGLESLLNLTGGGAVDLPATVELDLGADVELDLDLDLGL